MNLDTEYTNLETIINLETGYMNLDTIINLDTGYIKLDKIKKLGYRIYQDARIQGIINLDTRNNKPGYKK